jgi:uncharacterized protein (DUF2236 family)
MPKSAAKSPKIKSQKKSKGKSSAQMMAVTSHVERASPQLHAEFQQLWHASMKNAKVKKVIRDGPCIVTIYK